MDDGRHRSAPSVYYVLNDKVLGGSYEESHLCSADLIRFVVIFGCSHTHPYFNAMQYCSMRHDSTRHTPSASINFRFNSHYMIFVSSEAGHIERQSFQLPHIKPFHIFLFHLFAFQLLKKQTTLFLLNSNARLLHAYARTWQVLRLRCACVMASHKHFLLRNTIEDVTTVAFCVCCTEHNSCAGRSSYFK